MIAFFASMKLFVKSGGLSVRMRKQTESILKRIIRDGKLVLLSEEQAEKIALAQHNKTAQDVVLLIFTTRRLLLYFLSWGKISKIEQLPFASIIRDVQPPIKSFIDGKPCLRVSIMIDGEKRDFTFYHLSEDFLRQLQEEFSTRVGKQSGIQHANLCLTCLQPMQGDYCLTCASQLTADWKPVWLSLLFPGLGQLRNGEMQKGLVYVIMATLVLLIEYVGIKGWFFEGAELTFKQKANLVKLLMIGLVLYISNVIDAYRSSIRAKKKNNHAIVKQ
jgi:hypothetical protein